MARLHAALSLLMLATSLAGSAQHVDVSFHVHRDDGHTASTANDPVVVWLTPLDPATISTSGNTRFKMNQKEKQFVPHLLVVPVGSTVEFPNLDPFFHNVFSLFNGRRFDLGLYQTGQSQAVNITREGISYIFCNIHPEMGGVILSLATPYYVVTSNADALLKGLPPGNYRLGVWSERATPESIKSAVRNVEVATGHPDLGTVNLEQASPATHKHRNKYGEEYPFQGP